MKLAGLKAGVSFRRHNLAMALSLLVDIILDDFLVHFAHRLSKIFIRPISPPRKLLQPGNSFLKSRLVPPLNYCITSATLILDGIWTIMWIWSSMMLSALIHHPFILDASFDIVLRRMDTLPWSTRLRIFGIHTRWYWSRCLVCAPVAYLAIARLCLIHLPSARNWLRSGMPFFPKLESLGFAGML